jgi:AbrB family looped-hinge helix DNA binding protein
MYQATLTSQGQITVPVEVRNMLGIEAGDKLFFWKDSDNIVISKDGGIESLRGILTKYAVGKPKLTKKRLEKLREEAYTERYKRYLKQNEKSNS